MTIEEKCEDCKWSKYNEKSELMCNEEILRSIYRNNLYCSRLNPTNNCERYRIHIITYLKKYILKK